MSDHTDRVEELIAAAAASELSADERAELDALRAEDPSIDATLAEFNDLVPGLRDSVGHWEETEPPARLGRRIEELAALGSAAPDTGTARSGPEGPADPHTSPAVGDDEPHAHKTPRPSSGLRTKLTLAAVGCVIAGTGGTLVVQQIIDSPPDGPPGTYGAVEEVSFVTEPAEVDIDGSLVAHTWGTETVLEMEGLEPGVSFSVVLVADDGEEFSSGTFFGSEVLIECRMNAAIMRDDVDRVEITTDDGDLIAQADLPEAIDPE